MMPIKVLMSVLRDCTGRSISSIVKELVFNYISRGKKKKDRLIPRTLKRSKRVRDCLKCECLHY